MRAQKEKLRPGELPAKARPIEFLTENGFSIIRPWETDRLPPPATGEYGFIVRDPHEREREVVVQVADELIAQIEIQTRRRILLGSSFWICCAEQRLANYLWENDGYPPGDKLLIEQLNPRDINSANRWRMT